MNEEEYIKNRIDDQIDWYNRKGKINKQYHLRSKGIVIFFSSVITLLSGFDLKGKDVILGILGSLIATITGIASLNKYQEKWSEYRISCEDLQQEKFLFLTRSGPYDDNPESFKLLVSRVENLLNKEHSRWSQNVTKES